MKLHLPAVFERILDNGLRVVMLSDASRPVLNITLQIPRGRWVDKKGLEGAAECVASLLPLGSAGRSAEACAALFEQAGAIASADVRDELFNCSLRCLSNQACRVVAPFADMVMRPDFDAREFARVRKEMVAGLCAETSDQGALATRHFDALLFGTDVPAGRHATPKTVKAISVESVREWYHVNIIPDGAVLVIAGDLAIADMEYLVLPLFEQWQGSAAPDVPSALPQLLSASSLRLVDRPDLTQTTLLMGHGVPAETHPDRLALSFANYILGGGSFQSRLMTQVRSRLGRTYGIGSNLSCGRDHGVFAIQTATRSESLAEVIETIQSVCRDFSEKGITPVELDEAVRYATGHLAFEIEGVNSIVDKLLWLRLYNRDNGWFESLPDRFAALTVDSVNAAITRHLSTSSLAIVAVGRAADIKPVLDNLGPVAVRSHRTLEVYP